MKSVEVLEQAELTHIDIDGYISTFHNPANVNERQWASEEIAKIIPGKITLSSIIEKFSSEVPKLQRFLLKSIARSKEVEAIDCLVGALFSPDDETRWLAAFYLHDRHMNEEQKTAAETYIKKHFRREKVMYLMTCICLLKNPCFAGSKYRKEIINNLSELDLPLQCVVLSQFPSWLDQKEGKQKLLAMASHDHPAIRETVIDTLQKYGLEKAVLQTFEHDPDTQISRKAKRILGKDISVAVPSFEKEKIMGAIFGAAVGDAVGAPIEFLSREEVQRIYGEEIKHFLKAEKYNQKLRLTVGHITDDSTMGLSFLQSYVENGFLDMSAVGRIWGEEARKIDGGESPNIGFAGRSLWDMRKLYLGCNWRVSGHGSASGCGAAMRAFALPFISPSSELVQNTEDSAIMTHNSPRGIASALVVVEAIKYLLQQTKLEPSTFLDHITKKIEKLDPELADKLRKLNEYLEVPTLKGLNVIGTRGEAIDTVPAALYCFLKSSQKFVSTLPSAINVDGDSDSIGSIACALSGAYNGVQAIPNHILEGLYVRNDIDTLLKKYFRSTMGNILTGNNKS